MNPRGKLEAQYHSWSSEQKANFYDSLFRTQVDDGAILPYQLWSPIFPGPSTFRGETYGKADPDLKAAINQSLTAASWTERKESALRILEPFRAFREMIEQG